MKIVVNVSDLRCSHDADAVLATYSLGSCIGVTMYDPVAKVGGLLHFQLPTSTMDLEKAKARPEMFADTGMSNLLRKVSALGGQKERLKIHLAGAAQMLNGTNLFDIGRRNHVAVRKLLWQQGMFIQGEAIGGSAPRNVYLAIADGAVTIKTAGEDRTF